MIADPLTKEMKPFVLVQVMQKNKLYGCDVDRTPFHKTGEAVVLESKRKDSYENLSYIDLDFVNIKSRSVFGNFVNVVRLAKLQEQCNMLQ